ncbi:MAG: outer membrane protein transport protein [Deltaproteobacteria bacterium]|nr:outer membrane protein transport protein [Deltaproteobacteria bacterium]MCW5801916.1 outer membrane protein transport protein [Deltaproteobacteria bacterium]
MKLRELVLPTSLLAVIAAGHDARAGGLFLPGSGAISTARAGAAVASTDDGEALSINPAGLAKSSGTSITLSAAIISYSMQFTRRGTYDDLPMEDQPWEGTPYPTVTNNPRPSLGIGSFQPVPVFAVVSDLGKRVKGLTVAAGVYAPNAYPFRDMTNGYPLNPTDKFDLVDFSKPPPPTRYDILKQDAAVILPSIAAAYRINDQLDVGARLSLGFADVKTSVVLWGNASNFEEDPKQDSLLDAEASAVGVFGYGAGATYRPTKNIELGAVFNSGSDIHAKGTARDANGPGVLVTGASAVSIRPRDDIDARCAKGGTQDAKKICVDFALPATASLGGRYKFLDGAGRMRGDVELQLGWENWSAKKASTYFVVVDARAALLGPDGEETGSIILKDSEVAHNFQDTFNVRLGGSFVLPQGGGNEIVLRAGVGHDTAAAKPGWLRADVDGAARTTFTVGGSFKTRSWTISAGGGFIYEGSPSNPGTCNPTRLNTSPGPGCVGDGTENPVGPDRAGPDPIHPIIDPALQAESPVAQGDYKSHYVLFMLGATAKF